MDTRIRPLVTLLHKFAKEASDVMAPVFPALEQVGEIRIKLASLLTRLALGKRASR